MKIMRTLTFLLFALIITLSGFQLLRGSLPKTVFGSTALASMSESGLRLPKAEVDSVIKQARSAMFAHNSSGRNFANVATGASWFNIVCSMVITVVLGWAGKSVMPTDVPGSKELTVGLTTQWAKVIGFTAALAAASAFGGNQVQQSAEAKFTAARSLNALIGETQRALGSGDAVSQREALDRLRLEAQKL